MTHRRGRVGFAVVVAAGLMLAACGSGDDGAASSTTAPPGSTETAVTTSSTVSTTTTGVIDGGGWIGGEPNWGSVGDGADPPAAELGDHDGGASTASDEAAGRSGGTFAPGAPGPADSPTLGPLRAGSVDDNADLGRFLDYLARIEALGIPLRPYDPTGRVVVSVVGSTGLPVSGAEVVVTDGGGEVARLLTTADGTARFHPRAHGRTDGSFTFTVGEVSVEGVAGGEVALDVPAPGGSDAPIALDVLFLLDATGSMGDEIDQLKVSIDSVAERVAALEALPDVRFAMTLYRDEGDEFVTATFDFTGDVAVFRRALADVRAEGGGDYPEALDEGLAEALTLPAWRDPSSTVQLVFLVADAPPQVGREVPTPYPDSIRDAVGRGIKIFPVASSESDDQAEAVFRQLAQATGARFVFLAYGAGGAATGSSTDIDRTDYEELALDDLVVRLIAEELAHLTGEPGQIPPPSPTTTTVPPNQ